jgi:predicted Ser/Thr protein kinase
MIGRELLGLIEDWEKSKKTNADFTALTFGIELSVNRLQGEINKIAPERRSMAVILDLMSKGDVAGAKKYCSERLVELDRTYVPIQQELDFWRHAQQETAALNERSPELSKVLHDLLGKIRAIRNSKRGAA